jgi:ABC-2 type transport system ATP-binding protein
VNIIEVKNLTKKFGDFIAVDDVGFNLQEGEILGLLGPNGAGKTTTIQMLLAVLNSTRGNISYFGKDLKKHREEILEQVNFSSTYTNLPQDLKVREIFKYTAYFYQIKNRKEQIEKIKDLFRLSEIWEERISELSAGQITRVNLAKAFINFPRVLLLDEPTASLDPEVARYIRDFLIEERKKFKVSIILTSHNMAEVQEVCDRVIFLNNGKIVANDTPENLAKSIKIVHVEFLIKDGLKRTEEYCLNLKVPCRIKGRYITVDIKEDAVADFIEKLKIAGIQYDEISIQKPTLEDYFFQVASENIKNNQKHEG